MSETKTYVFGNDGQCGGGSMMSMLAPLLQQRGLDPNLLLAMNRGGGFGNGEGSWFIWLLFILCFCGWGGNGFGFGGNGRGNIANEINNDYGRSLLMDAIGGNRNALSNLATQLNCTEGQIQSAISALTSQVQSVGNQVGMSGMQTINALQQGNMQIAQQLANCCCESSLLTVAARIVLPSVSRLTLSRVLSTTWLTDRSVVLRVSPSRLSARLATCTTPSRIAHRLSSTVRSKPKCAKCRASLMLFVKRTAPTSRLQ